MTTPATKTKLMNPLLLNFENYDGMVAPDKYATAFGGLVYVAAAYLMRLSELQEVIGFVRGRFRGAAVMTEQV